METSDLIDIKDETSMLFNEKLKQQKFKVMITPIYRMNGYFYFGCGRVFDFSYN